MGMIGDSSLLGGDTVYIRAFQGEEAGRREGQGDWPGSCIGQWTTSNMKYRTNGQEMNEQPNNPGVTKHLGGEGTR